MEIKPHAGQVLEALKTKFSGTDYAFLTEVPAVIGGQSRRIDALTMGLWQSRGLDLSAYEIKVNRSDWLSELKKPEKAEEINKYTDFMWLVISDAKIAKMEEIPQKWGLMVYKSEKLWIEKKAERLNPIPITREFLAAMLRVACQSDRNIENEISNKLYSEYRRGYDQGIEDAKIRAEKAETIISEFNRLSGIHMSEYNYGEISALLPLLRNKDLVNNFIQNHTSKLTNLLFFNKSNIEQFQKQIEDLNLIKNNLNSSIQAI